MIKISINRREQEAIFGRLRTIDRKDIDPIKQSARFARAELAKTYDAQRDPYGVPWRPLSEVTLRIRRAKGRTGTEILKDTLKMRRSLRVRDDKVEIRTPAEFHQKGGWGRMFGKQPRYLPQRKILPITKTGRIELPKGWKDQFAKFFARWLLRNE